jgi:replication factor C small subunit
MKIVNYDEDVWAERYRPQTVEDVILPLELKNKVLGWIRDRNMQNLGIFSVGSGTGKSTLSKAILRDLDADSIFINASKDNGVDMLRGRIANFASNKSYDGEVKIVVLDEADGTSDAFQNSARAFLDEFSQNCRFILTGNFANKIIDPILKRLVIFDFDVLFSQYKGEIAKQILARLQFILENEKITYDTDELKTLIKMTYPSIRETLIVLQSSVVDGELRLDKSYIELNKNNMALLESIKAKKFDTSRKIISTYHNPFAFYGFITGNLEKLVQLDSMPIVIITTYNFMNSNVNGRDPEVALGAYCASLMRTDIKWN